MIAVAVSPPAADAAFFVVFGAFAIAFVVLSVITLKWALLRDRAGRRGWAQRQQSGQAAAEAQLPPPATNGRPPSKPPS